MWIRVFGVTSSFAFLSRKKKCVEWEKAVSPRSHLASQHVYIHVYFVHIYECISAEIQSIWILWAFQESRPDPWAHISVSHVQCVCVCVYTHTHPHTLHSRQKIKRIQTKLWFPFSLMSKITSHASKKCPAD